MTVAQAGLGLYQVKTPNTIEGAAVLAALLNGEKYVQAGNDYRSS
jgi:hypothetical protein